MSEMEALQRHFDTLPEAFALLEILLDADKKPYDFRFMYVNQALIDLQGLSKEQIQGSRFYQIFPEGSRKWLPFLYDAAFQRKKHVLRKFFSPEINRYLRIICYPWPGSHLCACLLYDETEFVRADQRLYTANEQLCTAEKKMKEACQQAEQANTAKTAFLRAISHDMRTPLSGIISYTELALNAKHPELTHEYLEKIQSSGKLLLQLINNTLDLSKIETGTVVLNPEPVNTGVLLQEVIDAVKVLMEQKKIDFKVSTGNAALPNVYVDIMRMKEILINLLSNAMKFTAVGGCVTFLVDTLHISRKMVQYRITVRDNGCGMSEDFLPRLFDPFTQETNPMSGKVFGSGLGMSIVKQLVECMGGTIQVKSELEKGTEFVINLKLKIAPTRIVERLEDKIGDVPLDIIHNTKLLLCEDHTINQEIVTAIMELQDAEVICAANGQEGVELFRQSEPGEFAAVLMDEQMPVMDGFKAAKKIRSLERADAKIVPILALTGNAYADAVQHEREAGMDAHIVKPFEPGKLLATLAQCMLRKRAQAKE